MKLETALRMAAVCGLTTYGEAYDNIVIHSGQLFAYGEISEEMSELYWDMIDEVPQADWSNALIPQHIIEEENEAMDKYFSEVLSMAREYHGCEECCGSDFCDCKIKC